MSTPRVASIQFFWYIAARATMRVIELERMLASVPLTTCCTPEMSLVMRVMMSPCLWLVKNDCGIFCRWAYIVFRMS